MKSEWIERTTLIGVKDKDGSWDERLIREDVKWKPPFFSIIYWEKFTKVETSSRNPFSIIGFLYMKLRQLEKRYRKEVEEWEAWDSTPDIIKEKKDFLDKMIALYIETDELLYGKVV